MHLANSCRNLELDPGFFYVIAERLSGVVFLWEVKGDWYYCFQMRDMQRDDMFDLNHHSGKRFEGFILCLATLD